MSKAIELLNAIVKNSQNEFTKPPKLDESESSDWSLTLFTHNDGESKYFMTKFAEYGGVNLPFGTVGRIVAMQDRLRSYYENKGNLTLTLAAGDMLQPSGVHVARGGKAYIKNNLTIDDKTYKAPYTKLEADGVTPYLDDEGKQVTVYANFYSIPIERKMFQKLKFDVIVPGNHEFAFVGDDDTSIEGLDQFSNLIKELGAAPDATSLEVDSTKSAVLMANYKFVDGVGTVNFGTNEEPLNKDYSEVINKFANSCIRTKTVNGVTKKIGIIGLNSEMLASLTPSVFTLNIITDSIPSQSIENLAALIDAEYEKLHDKDADVVIVCSHLNNVIAKEVVGVVTKPIAVMLTGGKENLAINNDSTVGGEYRKTNVPDDIVFNKMGHRVIIPGENSGNYGYIGAHTVTFSSTNTVKTFVGDNIAVMHPSFYSYSNLNGLNRFSYDYNDELKAIMNSSDVEFSTDPEIVAIQNAIEESLIYTDSDKSELKIQKNSDGQELVLKYNLTHEKPFCRTDFTNLSTLSADATVWYSKITKDDTVAVAKTKVQNMLGGTTLTGWEPFSDDRVIPLAFSSAGSLRGSMPSGRVPAVSATVAKGYGNKGPVKLMKVNELVGILEIMYRDLPTFTDGRFNQLGAGFVDSGGNAVVRDDGFTQNSTNPMKRTQCEILFDTGKLLGNRVRQLIINDVVYVDNGVINELPSGVHFLVFGTYQNRGKDGVPAFDANVNYKSITDLGMPDKYNVQFNSDKALTVNGAKDSAQIATWDMFLDFLYTYTIPEEYAQELVKGVSRPLAFTKVN